METPDLTATSFWEGGENHIAVNPARARDATGLAEFAREALQASGWCFFQTSGSEGWPKWVALTKEGFLISARVVNDFLGCTSADRWLVALPLHHVGGFAIHARCFVSGAQVYTLPGKWDATAFAAKCAELQITLTSLVPTQLHDLVSANVTAPSSLRAVVIGGGALSSALQERALELGWPVRASYGMTEAASQIATQPAGGNLPGEALELLLHWEGSTTEEWVFRLRGPALARGYAFRAGEDWRWQPINVVEGLLTRDRVDLRTEGGRRLLRFCGRDSAFIKVCGELVNLHALQQRLDDLAQQQGLDAPAVLVPVPDERREVALVLVTVAGTFAEAQRADLLTAYNTSCQPFERVHAHRELAEVPRTELGKVNLDGLIQMIGRLEQSRI